MADQIIDRLVSSLAAGMMGTDEFIDAVESQVLTISPAAKHTREQPQRSAETAVRS